MERNIPRDSEATETNEAYERVLWNATNKSSRLQTNRTIEAPNHNNADNETEAGRAESSRRDESDRVAELLNSTLYTAEGETAMEEEMGKRMRKREVDRAWFPLVIVSSCVAFWLTEIDRWRWESAKDAAGWRGGVFDNSGVA